MPWSKCQDDKQQQSDALHYLETSLCNAYTSTKTCKIFTLQVHMLPVYFSLKIFFCPFSALMLLVDRKGIWPGEVLLQQFAKDTLVAVLIWSSLEK